MKRSLAFVYVLGLFLLGIVIGALGMHLYEGGRPARHFGRGEGGSGGPAGGFLDRIEHELGLSSDQLERIEEIFLSGRDEAEALRRQVGEQVRPMIEEHMQRKHEEIAAVLTPEQQEKFEQLRHRFERHADWFLFGREHGRHSRRHGP